MGTGIRVEVTAAGMTTVWGGTEGTGGRGELGGGAKADPPSAEAAEDAEDILLVLSDVGDTES